MRGSNLSERFPPFDQDQMQSELKKRFEDFQKILDTISIKSNYVDVIAVSKAINRENKNIKSLE